MLYLKIGSWVYASSLFLFLFLGVPMCMEPLIMLLNLSSKRIRKSQERFWMNLECLLLEQM